MEYLWIPASVLLFLCAAVLIIAYLCFRMAFYVPKNRPSSDDVLDLPHGEIYEPYREYMERCAANVHAMPHEDLWITSFDGLQLYGRLFECETPDTPIELMLHGYRGSAERDLSGGVERCFKLQHSVLLVDHRGCGKSEGNVITFGIREYRDCLSWLQLLQEKFPHRKVILTGVSMGAATVLMAAGTDLPENVIGVLADCGYTSPKDIIKVVIRQMKLPPALSYPFVKLGARLYGHFDLEETSPTEALKNCKVPVIFFHGEADAFVPCEMSRINFETCVSKKMLVTVPGAGHGLSYPVAPKAYLQAMREFFNELEI